MYIYNTIATGCWWNFIYRLLINGRSRAHKLFGEILKIFLTFLPMSVKIVAPPNNLVQNDADHFKLFLPLKTPQML